MKTENEGILHSLNEAAKQNLAVIDGEIEHAVNQLGYRLGKQVLTIDALALCRYLVHYGKTYVGIWDSARHTFVD